jgi:anthranilate phosphoribosyltransferase
MGTLTLSVYTVYGEIIAKLTARRDLAAEEITELLGAIRNDEISEVQTAGFLVALLMKEPTPSEISSIVKAMRPSRRSIWEFLDSRSRAGGSTNFFLWRSRTNVGSTSMSPFPKARPHAGKTAGMAGSS